MSFKKIIRNLSKKLGYDIHRYPESCERLIPHLEMMLPLHRINTVIDVGANVGQFASEVRALSREIQIHSIEPNPVICKTLAARAAGDKRWTTHECAVGQSKGKIMLNVFASSDFSSCLPANEFGAQRFQDSLTVADTVEVELKTLDELISSIPPTAMGSRLLLKLDTQGFDMEALLGAPAVLESVHLIITEASLRPLYKDAPVFSEVFSFLENKGFLLSGFFPVTRDENLSIIESDCVFVRANGN